MTSFQSTLLNVHGLTKQYRRGPEEIQAVADVSLEIAPGELIGLLGPSGSGKTTLLNLLCGWERPDAGEIFWRGDLIGALGTLPWSEIAVVPQGVALAEELSIRQNIGLPLRLSGQWRTDYARDRVQGLLERLGLAGLYDRLPHEVSLGEQQRASLAMSLVVGPRLILADEPTGHQDSVWTHGVLRALMEARSQGTSVLIATHSTEALKHVDRIVSMRDGRLTESPLHDHRAIDKDA